MLEPSEEKESEVLYHESPILISSDSGEDINESLEETNEETDTRKKSLVLFHSDYQADLKRRSEKDVEKEIYQESPVLIHTVSSKEINNSRTESPDFEKDISKAYEDSIKEESILPILKHELRLKIQTRRLSQGQEELKSEEKEPKVYELTEEEKVKYQRRLDQNRQSLQRARQKAVEHEEKLKMTFDVETSRNAVLQRERNKLQLEKDNLLKDLHNVGMELDSSTSTISCNKCKMTFLYLVPREQKM